MNLDEYYKILGLKPGASVKEVKSARNEMLEVWHPDRFQHKPDIARKATEQTKQINDAYHKIIKHFKNNHQTADEETYSNSKQRSANQAEDVRRAEYERQQREKAEQERKERNIEHERLAKEKAAQDIARQSQKNRLIKRGLFAGGFLLLSLLSVSLLSFFQSSKKNANEVQRPPVQKEVKSRPTGGVENYTQSQEIIDELNGSSFGNTHGITYVPALDGQGANFSRQGESRIEYSNIPGEGTLEWWIYVRGGYQFSDYKLEQNHPNALIFTTAGGDVWYPGSTWLNVHADGTLTLEMATTKYDGPKQILRARNTKFQFNQWHSIGISFGEQGQFIMLDGLLVATAPQNKQKLGRGGTHYKSIDIPTTGEMVSGYWSNNQWDHGFEGIVDRFRTSSNQKDWKLSTQTPR